MVVSIEIGIPHDASVEYPRQVSEKRVAHYNACPTKCHPERVLCVRDHTL
jgi:hypothetical protein